MSVMKIKLAAFMLVLAPLTGQVQQAQAQENQKLLNMCIACHGIDGSNNYGSIPNLKGQNAQYMIEQLKQFKSDQRQDKTMSKVAKLLTEEQMQFMAHYFSTGKEQY
ncbi:MULTISPECIES: c-type cytochrome [unclassified Shewanella]|uniref:c-type cytochrome n=1 Tax=unclassified Shewanella TaxID=196818 RepID=UPI000C7BE28A|nr:MULTISPECIES: c-type cytochrome [unclassified Shewanella]PKG56654.1 cytochrome C [Shewanella sp. GutDb-MelDb]PKG76797.1 cytochrome C [Shewanella sp. GutCb]